MKEEKTLSELARQVKTNENRLNYVSELISKTPEEVVEMIMKGKFSTIEDFLKEIQEAAQNSTFISVDDWFRRKKEKLQRSCIA